MSNNLAIKVDSVSKTFKLPHDKNTSIKGAFLNFFNRKRTFETQQALDNISFEVKQGEFFGIVGRNGSGKSTLLKMLAGIYEPSHGAIQVNGKLTPFIELGVGFNPELTGRENVFLNGALLGFNRKEMNAMYDDIVEFSEIGRFMDQKLKNYSSGMQVRLAFSVAIQAKSDILLLDEVLAVGDAAFQQKCYTYFEKLKRENKTVIFVTHDMGAVSRFCTRAIYIKDSKMLLDGTPHEIVDLYREENISKEKPSTKKNEKKTSNEYSIGAKIVSQNEKTAVAEIKYESKSSTKTYVGISVSMDGRSVAEISTDPKKPLKGDGTLRYTIDTSLFNAGVYEFTAALFKLENRELLAFMKQGAPFVIKGDDPTRGSALRLEEDWDYIEGR